MPVDSAAGTGRSEQSSASAANTNKKKTRPRGPSAKSAQAAENQPSGVELHERGGERGSTARKKRGGAVAGRGGGGGGGGSGGAARRGAKQALTSGVTDELPNSSAPKQVDSTSNLSPAAAPAPGRGSRRPKQRTASDVMHESQLTERKAESVLGAHANVQQSSGNLHVKKREVVPRVSVIASPQDASLLSAPNARIVKVAVRCLPNTTTVDELLATAAARGCDMRSGADCEPLWSALSTDSMSDVPYACFYVAWRSLEPARKLQSAMNGFRFQDKKSMNGKAFSLIVERAQYHRIPSEALAALAPSGGGRKAAKHAGKAMYTHARELSGTIHDDIDYKAFLAAHSKASSEASAKRAPGVASSALLPALGALSLKEEMQKPKPPKPALFDAANSRNMQPIVTPLMLEVREKRREREARRTTSAASSDGKRASSFSSGAACGINSSPGAVNTPASASATAAASSGAAHAHTTLSSSKRKPKNNLRVPRSGAGAKEAARSSEVSAAPAKNASGKANA